MKILAGFKEPVNDIESITEQINKLKENLEKIIKDPEFTNYIVKHLDNVIEATTEKKVFFHNYPAIVESTDKIIKTAQQIKEIVKAGIKLNSEETDQPTNKYLN